MNESHTPTISTTEHGLEGERPEPPLPRSRVKPKWRSGLAFTQPSKVQEPKKRNIDDKVIYKTPSGELLLLVVHNFDDTEDKDVHYQLNRDDNGARYYDSAKRKHEFKQDGKGGWFEGGELESPGA